jgi:nitrous oxidase accessory protein NosD
VGVSDLSFTQLLDIGYVPDGSVVTAKLADDAVTEKKINKKAVANVLKFGAVGDGNADDTNAIQNAANSLVSGGIIEFPAGTYKTSNRIFLSGNAIQVVGAGEKTVIQLTNSSLPGFFVKAMTGGTITGVKIVGNNSTRNTSQQAILIQDSQNITIQSVVVDGSNSSGLAIQRSNNIKVINNVINNTLAEGIVVTDQSKRILIDGNFVTNSGDDAITVVSYTYNTNYCEDIIVTNNNVFTSRGRGITHLGGRRVTIDTNIINGTAGSGVLITLDATFNTFESNSTIISNNQVLSVGSVSIPGGYLGNKYGVEVTASTFDTHVLNNTISGGASHGIVANGQKLIMQGNSAVANMSDGFHIYSMSDLVFNGNRAENNGDNGGFFSTISDSTVTDNVFYNNNTNNLLTTIDNLYLTNCSFLTVAHNVSIDDRGSPRIQYAIELDNISNSLVAHNIIKGNTGLAPVFVGSNCSNIERETIYSNSDPLDQTYKPGQFYFNFSTGKMFVYSGGAVWNQLGSGNAVVSGGASDWTQITNKPTTIAGYGITDAYAKSGGAITGPVSIGGALTVNGTVSSTGNITAPNYTGRLNNVNYSVSPSAPSSPVTNDLWVDTAGKSWNRWTGTAWEVVGGGIVSGGTVTDGAITTQKLANGAVTDVKMAQAKVANVRAYGAIGDGAADDTNAFKNAIISLGTGGGTLKVPAGTYKIGDINAITVPIIIEGAGEGSVIWSQYTGNAVIRFSGVTGGGIRDVKITSVATARNASQEGVAFWDCSRMFIDHVTVDGTASTAFIMRRTNDSKITNCNYMNTYADGLHIVEGCKRIQIIGNRGENTGDDAISIVSYTAYPYCEDIVVMGNHVINSKARGITHVGGKRVIIANNTINGTSSSGILADKDTGFGTYEPNDTIIANNTIINVGSVTPLRGNQFGIEITYAAVNTLIENNIISGGTQRSLVATGRKLAIRGNTAMNSPASGFYVFSTNGLIFTDNRSEYNAQYGAYFDNITYSTVSDNVMYNNNTGNSAGIDNMNFNNCTFNNVHHNVSTDDRGTVLVDKGIEFYNSNDNKISQNMIKVSSQIAPVFTGTSANNERVEVIVDVVDPTTTVYKPGQLFFNSARGKLFTYSGGATWVILN